MSKNKEKKEVQAVCDVRLKAGSLPSECVSQLKRGSFLGSRSDAFFFLVLPCFISSVYNLSCLCGTSAPEGRSLHTSLKWKSHAVLPLQCLLLRGELCATFVIIYQPPARLGHFAVPWLYKGTQWNLVCTRSICVILGQFNSSKLIVSFFFLNNTHSCNMCNIIKYWTGYGRNTFG